MSSTITMLIAAWPLVVKRSLAHWRLVSSVVIGVLMASSIMAGTVIYYDALRELALDNTLRQLATTDKDILIKAERGPTSYEEYEKVARLVNAQIDARVGPLLRDTIRGGKTSTYYLSRPGEEESAGSDNARTYFAYLPRLTSHITLIEGVMPQERALASPDAPFALEALIPKEAADLFGLAIGARLSAVPYWDDAIPYTHVVVSGIFERNDPEEEFWYLDEMIFKSSTSGNFRTVPFFVSEDTFMHELGEAFVDLDSTYAWLMEVDPDRIDAGNATDVRDAIALMERQLSSNLFSYRHITLLDEALGEYDRRLFFSKLPMFIILVLIAVVILYYVVTLSSLLVEQQRTEIALLRSRGASSTQILVVFFLEGVTISVLAIALAPLLAAAVIGLLGFTPSFSALSGADRLTVHVSRGAYLMGALGGLLSFVALVIPAVQASRIGVVRHRQEASRPTGQPFFQRFYLDILLLAISLFLFRKLSQQGSVVVTGLFGDVAEDYVLLAVPALTLVAAGMVLLRLFPLSIRFLSGDSPVLLHLMVGGTTAALTLAVAATALVESSGALWLAQVALLGALAAAYWATTRAQQMLHTVAGMALQAGLVACVVLVGPTLPEAQIFVPLLVAIVPAQLTYAMLTAFALRAPVGFSMGLWQMARNPTHYARLSLLLILMAGLGIFSASFGGTLSRSFEERAFYSSGAEIRLEGLLLNSRGSTRPIVASYEEIPGVERATPVIRAWGMDLSKLLGVGYTMFAVDRQVFDEIAWFRDDFADEPVPGLLRSLDAPSMPEEVALPMDAETIGIVLKADRPHATVAVTAQIKDANDRYFSYYLGGLASGDWTRLETSLVASGRRGRNPLQPTQPLSLVSVAIHETNPLGRLRSGSLTIDEIDVGTKSNGAQVIESFEDVSAWSVISAAPEAVSDTVRPSTDSTPDHPRAATFIWSDGSAMVGRGIFYGPPLSPLPVLASMSFIEDSGHSVGDRIAVSVRGHHVPVRLVEAVDYFPTLDTNNDLFLIADLTSLSRYANLEAPASEVRPNEIWLSTRTDGADRQMLVERLRTSEPFSSNLVHDRAEYLAASQVDPLVEAGWEALLFIAFSAVLVLSGLGFLVHAYVSFRSREVQFALMRTIGFSMRQLMMLVWLEQALVIAAGLAMGTWMGGRLGAVIMPYLGHDDTGRQVLPPFTMEVDWGTLIIIYAAMAVMFALITSGVIWFIHRISLQRILRLGEM